MTTSMERDRTVPATDQFARTFGHIALGVWSAPGRVNLIGEHTDYNGGLVLPFAIDRRTRCVLAVRRDRTVHVASTLRADVVEASLDDDLGATTGWAAYVLGVIWALGRHGVDLAEVPGVDILVDSWVPLGAGLASSAALECAVAIALDDAWGLHLPRETLAAVGRMAENEVVGAPTGPMDQITSLVGAADHAVLLDCATLEHSLVPLGLREAGLTAFIIRSDVEHEHATSPYSSRRAQCESAAAALQVPSLASLTVDDLDTAADRLSPEALRRVRHVITEIARVREAADVLASAGPGALGPILAASHASLRDDFEVSIPVLDLAVDAAVDAGAIGARMTGGGFGGSAIALVPTARIGQVQGAVRRALAASGMAPASMFTVVPSTGAAREQ